MANSRSGTPGSTISRTCRSPSQAYPETIIIDQNLARGSRRSNTATYTGILDNVRKAFAKANAVDLALFSANSKGRARTATGWASSIPTSPISTPWSPRARPAMASFLPEVLEHRLRGKSISDIYEMSVADAVDFFTEPAIAKILRGLDEVGLGYLTLGQPLSTLSGGERQRLKLAAELGKKGNTLIGLFGRLVDAGSTVIVIEHNLDVVSRADWVIELGPGAGHDGGKVVFKGPPAELPRHKSSLTGKSPAARQR